MFDTNWNRFVVTGGNTSINSQLPYGSLVFLMDGWCHTHCDSGWWHAATFFFQGCVLFILLYMLSDAKITCQDCFWQIHFGDNVLSFVTKLYDSLCQKQNLDQHHWNRVFQSWCSSECQWLPLKLQSQSCYGSKNLTESCGSNCSDLKSFKVA